MKPVQFARLMDVSAAAISKGCASGRLTPRSVRRSARGRVIDIDPILGAEEWERNRTRLAPAEVNGPRASAPPAPQAPQAPEDDEEAPTLLEARTRREAALAEIAELEAGKLRGALVSVAEVKAEWTKHLIAARNKILGLPTRIRQRLQHLSHADVATIDQLVRETLVDLAHEPEGTDGR